VPESLVGREGKLEQVSLGDCKKNGERGSRGDTAGEFQMSR